MHPTSPHATSPQARLYLQLLLHTPQARPIPLPLLRLRVALRALAAGLLLRRFGIGLGEGRRKELLVRDWGSRGDASWAGEAHRQP